MSRTTRRNSVWRGLSRGSVSRFVDRRRGIELLPELLRRHRAIALRDPIAKEIEGRTVDQHHPDPAGPGQSVAHRPNPRLSDREWLAGDELHPDARVGRVVHAEEDEDFLADLDDALAPRMILVCAGEGKGEVAKALARLRA